MAPQREIHFTVSAALLKELGEKLVGKAHIALAELVKNAYDADATRVVIRVGKDLVEVSDDGHGMSEEDFTRYWMRIGSSHKRTAQFSPNLRRPLTGSKGVGRLAVQFLGSRLEVLTTTGKAGLPPLVANLDWTRAATKHELTEAVAIVEDEPKAKPPIPGSKSGTRFRITGLTDKWGEEKLRDLARELWFLQPPFDSEDEKSRFQIRLTDDSGGAIEAFDTQFRKHLDLWHAKLKGQSKTRADGTPYISLSLQFHSEQSKTIDYAPDDGAIHPLKFELRIFKLQGRQAGGISLADFREYLAEHGGVLVYDAGFHLPYFGNRTQDWLGLERDHAHRLQASSLLPQEMTKGVRRAMNALPTTSRILGAVHIDTTRADPSSPHDGLAIQLTRDRLIENRAYKRLRDCVRWAIDYYAVSEQQRLFLERQVEPPRGKATARVREALDWLGAAKTDMPEVAFETIHQALSSAQEATEAQERVVEAHMGLLGSLATAGMATLAYEHEAAKQIVGIRRVLKTLQGLAETHPALVTPSAELGAWIDRLASTRQLFSHLLVQENRDRIERFRAVPVLEEARRQVNMLVRGLTIGLSNVDADIRLPPGTWAEWIAIFQNTLVNASNAMIDSAQRSIAISSDTHYGRPRILVQDTGVGVDLHDSDQLFEPFVRRLEISSERRGLGLGGTGLGLTIVRMIATKLDCRVRFVTPLDERYSTCFELSWSAP